VTDGFGTESVYSTCVGNALKSFPIGAAWPPVRRKRGQHLHWCLLPDRRDRPMAVMRSPSEPDHDLTGDQPRQGASLIELP
jgi:hypothetical protein